MLKLISEIYIIKNKATKIGFSDTQLNQELSTNFTLPTDLPTDLLKPIEKEAFLEKYDKGEDVYLKISFANNIKIESSFTKLASTAEFTIPRKMNWGGLDKMIKGRSSVFGRGDRVVIKCGYEYVNIDDKTISTSLKEVFRGYITSVGVSTPLTIHCEDMFFFLKNMRAQVDYWYDKQLGLAAKDLWTTNGKLTLKNLINRCFFMEYNTRLSPNQDVFKIVTEKSELNTLSKKQSYIPIYLPNDLDTKPISFVTKTEKNVGEICQDIKTKLHIYSYFDDFGNLHFELPFLNLNTIQEKRNFEFQKNIIDDQNLIFMNQDEKPIKVIISSKQTLLKGTPTYYANGPEPEKIDALGLKGKGISPGTTGFVGNQLGDSITVNTFDNVDQEDLNKYALQIWRANTYTGYKKGSSFTTFGEPAVYIGQGVSLKSKMVPSQITSIAAPYAPNKSQSIVSVTEQIPPPTTTDTILVPEFPEKEGDFAIVGIKRIFGVNGYRQEIEIGPKLNPENDG